MSKYYVDTEFDGRAWKTRLQISHNGQVIREEWDGGEPEDNTFSRDYAWVKYALEEAYRLGREDAFKEAGANDK